LPRDAYRVLGYRQCGERAVRVDILERLADLIRPALAWRETSPGEKPPGAFDGRSFVVTQAMTSLTGSAGEDFASILRALGYRMDRRPQLAPKPAVVEAAPSDTAPVETSAEAPATPPSGETASEATLSDATLDAVAETVAGETVSTVEAAPAADVVEAPLPEEAAASSTLLPQVDFAQKRDILNVATTDQEARTTAPEVVEAAPSVAIEAPAAQSSAEASSEAASASEATPADATAVPAQAELVEVWRPGGRSDERRPPRHDRKGHHRRPERAAADGASAAPGESASGEKSEGTGRERHRHGRRDRHRDFNKPRTDQPADGAVAATADGAPAREERRDDKNARPRERFDGKGREDRNRSKFRDDAGREGGRDKGRGGRDRDRGGRENGPSHRQYASSAAPRERDRPVDPNSPFAKLAALKEQMTANRKD
jgi:ATP-dependent RNA helicase SUPV3L1/SUV3